MGRGVGLGGAGKWRRRGVREVGSKGVGSRGGGKWSRWKVREAGRKEMGRGAWRRGRWWGFLMASKELSPAALKCRDIFKNQIRYLLYRYLVKI